MKIRKIAQNTVVGTCLVLSGLSPALAQDREESQAMILLRGLPTLDTSHSVAIVELDPESDRFGDNLSEV